MAYQNANVRTISSTALPCVSFCTFKMVRNFKVLSCNGEWYLVWSSPLQLHFLPIRFLLSHPSVLILHFAQATLPLHWLPPLSLICCYTALYPRSSVHSICPRQCQHRMSSRKTKQRTTRHSGHSAPYVASNTSPSPCLPVFLLLTSFSRIPSTSRRDTTLPSRPLPYRSDNSHHNPPSAYQAFTPQVLHEHEHSQLALHHDPTYRHTIHTQHDNQLDSSFDSLGVVMPDSVQSRVVQDPVGMTPYQRFEVESTYPYQRYNSYEPVIPQQQTSYPQPQYSNVAHHQYQHTTTSVHAAATSPSPAAQVYYAPQQEYYYAPATTYGEATSPGNDLAAVGTQFDGYVSTGYAQTS